MLAWQADENVDPEFFVLSQGAVDVTTPSSNALRKVCGANSEELENALLLVDPKTFLQFSKAMTDHKAGRKQITPTWPEYDATAISVFTEKDLLRDAEAAEQAENWTWLLYEMNDFWTAKTARQQLLNDPGIQQFLQPPSTQNNPSEPSK